jgi:hypothetical protein
MSSRQSTLFSIRAPLPKQTAFVLGLVAPVLVLGAWCVLTYGGFVEPSFLPKPTEVIRGTLQLFIQYDLLEAILISSRRIAIAFLLASAIALPLGVLMGTFDPINRFFEPIVAPLRYMPISAFIPLLIFWFGIYEKQKIAFLFLGVFVYLLPVVHPSGAGGVGPNGSDSRCFEVSSGQDRADPSGTPGDLRQLSRDERDRMDVRDSRRSCKSGTRSRLHG